VGRSEGVDLLSVRPIDPMAAAEVAEAPKARRPRFGRRAGATAGLLSPPMLWISLFFVVPVLMIALYSVAGISGLSPNDITSYSLTPWKDFLFEGPYMGLFWRSVRMSTIVSVTSVLLAYPVAYLLALVAGRRKYTLLLIIIVPFLTSYLLRVLAFRVILGDQGVINTALESLGVVDEPVSWLYYSQFAIYAVLSYVWVPFVALPIFVSLESMNTQLLEASSDLGASRLRTFVTVTLPLSMPGVIAAFIFVFIPTLGEYITPRLVGGPGGFAYFGSAIESAFTAGLDWQFGSAMSMFLVAAVGVLIVIFGRYLNTRTVAE
jgi:spermidine/putrescine transport system permease protein